MADNCENLRFAAEMHHLWRIIHFVVEFWAGRMDLNQKTVHLISEIYDIITFEQLETENS